ncbi:MAG: hypothetical protein C0626_07735 [Arcobacter sp.]|uniref:hypothetical protein n=1 Tax=uncultured Arcobacter sp. TaxID=165434 RepID=UPI000CB01DBE|nr:hypothetical protein [uncultured Arcobacter sp.]PLY09946.1 MAG: hypothetical protein C0626_07735 [Arcobacter sp.]
MNLIISLFYAPVVFYSLRNFELKTVSLIIFIFSLLWLLLSIKKNIKEYIFPLFYLGVSILAYYLENFLFLKILPLLISGLISIYILYSYISKNSFIFIFLEKFNKKVEKEEKEYIQKSTLFWFLISLLNVLIHSFVLYTKDMVYWTFYSSVGWYFLFILAGLIQFVHKKIYFKGKVHV